MEGGKGIIGRELEERVRPYMARREIVGIRGPRRAGKTTLMRMLQEKTKGRTALVNMDLLEHQRALEDNPLEFINRYRKGRGKTTVFLDEIQRVREAGQQLKIIVDECPWAKMVVSGSSSLEMKARVLAPLVGRILLFELLPFSFGEFLAARKPDLLPAYRKRRESLERFLERGGYIEKPVFGSEFLAAWKEYAVYGGYPEVVYAPVGQKETVLRNIFNLYIEKDIAAFYGVEDTRAFEDFLACLAAAVASPLSLSSVAGDVGITHPKARGFLEILRHTYLTDTLRPFHRNATSEIKKAGKVYFIDAGMRNSALGNFAPFDNRADRGALAENFVYRQLRERDRWRMRVWRTAGKAEVDFVLLKGDTIVPLEVKLGAGSPGRSLYSFLVAYKPERAVIATLDTWKTEQLGKTTVWWVPAYYL